ncbi:phage tail protein [Microbispora sp. NPDC049633]|uniref:phage tail protein n=1 Tax=Microbispora sp. NPDC049633 TaxID=3154355 RepID=UPI0034413274
MGTPLPPGGSSTSVEDRTKTDPLRSFRFKVVFSDTKNYGFNNNSGTANGATGVTGFMNVTGLSMTTEVIPYREGGMNTTTRKMPGQSDYSPISLSRGLTLGNHAMYNWMLELFDVLQGNTTQSNTDFRMNVAIYLLAHPWPGPNPPQLAGWRIYNAWPTSLAFSDLDAGANSISISQMTLAHEGWEMILSDDRSNIDFQ